MLPIVSIVIPCYNHGAFLEETLASIVSSSLKYKVEVIIVNDGSTDLNTLNVFKRIEENGYFVLHQVNQGLARARNNGIRLAKGKYILPLDSDNNVCSPYLNKAIAILEAKENIAVLYGNALFIGEVKGIWKNKPLDKAEILLNNQIDACAIFRKSTWEAVNGYSEDMPFMGLEDWNFWLKCIDKNFTFYFLNEVCFEYRVLGSSMLRSLDKNRVNEIHQYNFIHLTDLYRTTFSKEIRMLRNTQNGGLFKRLIKTTFNYLGLYSYDK